MHRRMLPSVREIARQRRPAHDRRRRAGTRRGRSADAGDARPVPHPDGARRLARRSTWRGSRSVCSRGPRPRRSPRNWTPGRASGVDAWFDPGRPWFTLDASLRESMARIVGARPVEIALLNSLTVNIHLLLASFFRPDGRRRRILADGPLFPSDRHALTSHLAQRGLDPATDLVVIGPRDGRAPRPDRGPRDGHRRAGGRPRARLPERASTSRPGRRSRSSG